MSIDRFDYRTTNENAKKVIATTDRIEMATYIHKQMHKGIAEIARALEGDDWRYKVAEKITDRVFDAVEAMGSTVIPEKQMIDRLIMQLSIEEWDRMYTSAEAQDYINYRGKHHALPYRVKKTSRRSTRKTRAAKVNAAAQSMKRRLGAYVKPKPKTSTPDPSGRGSRRRRMPPDPTRSKRRRMPPDPTRSKRRRIPPDPTRSPSGRRPSHRSRRRPSSSASPSAPSGPSKSVSRKRSDFPDTFDGDMAYLRSNPSTREIADAVMDFEREVRIGIRGISSLTLSIKKSTYRDPLGGYSWPVFMNGKKIVSLSVMHAGGTSLVPTLIDLGGTETVPDWSSGSAREAADYVIEHVREMHAAMKKSGSSPSAPDPSVPSSPSTPAAPSSSAPLRAKSRSDFPRNKKGTLDYLKYLGGSNEKIALIMEHLEAYLEGKPDMEHLSFPEPKIASPGGLKHSDWPVDWRGMEIANIEAMSRYGKHTFVLKTGGVAVPDKYSNAKEMGDVIVTLAKKQEERMQKEMDTNEKAYRSVISKTKAMLDRRFGRAVAQKSHEEYFDSDDSYKLLSYSGERLGSTEYEITKSDGSKVTVLIQPSVGASLEIDSYLDDPSSLVLNIPIPSESTYQDDMMKKMEKEILDKLGLREEIRSQISYEGASFELGTDAKITFPDYWEEAVFKFRDQELKVKLLDPPPKGAKNDKVIDFHRYLNFAREAKQYFNVEQIAYSFREAGKRELTISSLDICDDPLTVQVDGGEITKLQSTVPKMIHGLMLKKVDSNTFVLTESDGKERELASIKRLKGGSYRLTAYRGYEDFHSRSTFYEVIKGVTPEYVEQLIQDRDLIDHWDLIVGKYVGDYGNVLKIERSGRGWNIGVRLENGSVIPAGDMAILGGQFQIGFHWFDKAKEMKRKTNFSASTEEQLKFALDIADREAKKFLDERDEAFEEGDFEKYFGIKEPKGSTPSASSAPKARVRVPSSKGKPSVSVDEKLPAKQREFLRTVQTEFQEVLREEFPEDKIAVTFTLGSKKGEVQFQALLGGIDRTFILELRDGREGYGLYSPMGIATPSGILLSQVKGLKADKEVSDRVAKSADQVITLMHVVSKKHPDHWIRFEQFSAKEFPTHDHYHFLHPDSGDLYAFQNDSSLFRRKNTLYHYKDGVYKRVDWDHVEGLPEEYAMMTIQRYEMEDLQKEAAEFKEREKESKELSALIERSNQLVEEAKELYETSLALEIEFDDAYPVERVSNQLKNASRTMYGLPDVDKIKALISELGEEMKKLESHIAFAREQRSQLVAKIQKQVQEARDLIASVDRSVFQKSVANVETALESISNVDVLRARNSDIEEEMNDLSKVADVLRELRDKYVLAQEGRNLLAELQDEFGDRGALDKKAEIYGIAEIVDTLDLARHELDFAATGPYISGAETLRKRIAAATKAAQDCRQELAALKSGSKVRIELGPKSRVASWRQKQIEEYDLLFMPEGREVRIGYSDRYYRQGDTLYHCSRHSPTPGGRRDYQIWMSLGLGDAFGDEYVRISSGELLPVSRVDTARYDLRLYQSGSRYFNQFGDEYQRDTNGLYHIDGSSGYIGKIYDDVWHTFEVEDDEISWSHVWGSALRPPERVLIEITSGSLTQQVLPSAHMDSKSVRGETVRGSEWKKSSKDVAALEKEMQQIQELYPMIRDIQALLLPDATYNEIYTDRAKYESIKPYLPDLQQAHNLLDGRGGHVGDGTIGNPDQQKYVSIFVDYKEALTMLKTMKEDSDLSKYDGFQEVFCRACYMGQDRALGLQTLRSYLEEHSTSEWARNLLIENLAYHPNATPEDRNEAVGLAEDLYLADPTDNRTFYARVLRANGQYREALDLMYESKNDEEKKDSDERLRGLSLELQSFLEVHGLTDDFKDGVIKGSVNIYDDSLHVFPEGIKKINGNLSIQSMYFSGLSNDLTEITGDCTITQSASLVSLAGAGLEIVGGDLMINNSAGLTDLPRGLRSVENLMLAFCINLASLPPHLHVADTAFIQLTTKITKIPPGFKAKKLRLHEKVRKRLGL